MEEIKRQKGRRYRVATAIPNVVHPIPAGTIVEVVGWHPKRGLKVQAVPCSACCRNHTTYTNAAYLEPDSAPPPATS